MQRFATGALLIMILSALAALPAGIPARAAAAELPSTSHPAGDLSRPAVHLNPEEGRK